MSPKEFRVPGHEGLQINVVDYGGEGPSLVLCHCTGTFARIWDPIVARLGEGFHIYAIDARGQGESEQPDDSDAYAWINSGRDLLAVIDALGLGRGIYAVGHSAGAAHIGYAEWLQPGTFSKAILIDPIIGPREAFAGESPLAASARRRRDAFENLESARERLGSKPPMLHWTPDTFEAYLANAFRTHEDGKLVLKCPGTREAWVYEHGGASDLFEDLGALDLPLLIVTAENSNVRMLAEWQAQRLRNARLETLPKVSHFIPQEAPDETVCLIREWLNAR